MKKLFAVLLTAIMLLSLTLTPAYACGECAEEGSGEALFIERYGSGSDDNFTYEEVYHYDNPYSDDYYNDWILVKASTNYTSDLKVKELIGDRIFAGEEQYPFSYGYAIFEYKYGGHFTELDSDCIMLYDGVMEALKAANAGRPVGDSDFDGQLTVMDSTYIQLALVKHLEFNELDDISNYCINVSSGRETIDYVSDINMDSEVNILDATTIQLKLAGLYGVYNEDRIVVEYDRQQYPDGYVDMPLGKELKFETIENFSDSSFDYSDGKTVHEIDSDHYITIIKSPEQFYETFNFFLDMDIVDFMNMFDDKWIVAAVTRVTDHKMVAQIENLTMKDGVLYVNVHQYIPNFNGTAQPTTPLYFSLTSVDKDDIALVTEIKWAK